MNAQATLSRSAPGALGPTGAHDPLTARELRVAGLAGCGLSNREIGELLDVSPRTVVVCLYRVFARLGVTSRVQLANALRDHQAA